MATSSRSASGFTLVELLVVLVILAVLGVVGVSVLGNRTANSVRAVLDEVEGTLVSAQKLAVATNRDVTLASQGNWDAANPMLLAQGVNQTAADILTNGAQSANSFRLALSTYGSNTGIAREHQNAGIVAASGTGSGWWLDAMQTTTAGSTNQDINTVDPFKDQPGFQGFLTTGNNLFQGGTSTPKSVTINGTSKRFNTGFWVEVVAMRAGVAVPGGAMGLLLVQANGANVFKFYNPGVLNGDGKWRRI